MKIEDIYKYKSKCKNCGRIFGSDRTKNKKLCPFCEGSVKKIWRCIKNGVS